MTDTFKSIIGLWPSGEEFAEDVGVRGVTARQWGNRDSIPAKYFPDIVAAAKRRGFDVSFEQLSRCAMRHRTNDNGPDDPEPGAAALKGEAA